MKHGELVKRRRARGHGEYREASEAPHPMRTCALLLRVGSPRGPGRTGGAGRAGEGDGPSEGGEGVDVGRRPLPLRRRVKIAGR